MKKKYILTIAIFLSLTMPFIVSAGVDEGRSSEIIRPCGSGQYTELSPYPSNYSNYECVDEEFPDDNGTYVYKVHPSWKQDLYEVENLSQNGSVDYIRVTVKCRKNGPGIGIPAVANKVKSAIYTNGTCYYGNENSLTSAWTYYSYTWYTNPSTGNSWNRTEVNDLQAGVALKGNLGQSQCTQVYVKVNYL